MTTDDIERLTDKILTAMEDSDFDWTTECDILSKVMRCRVSYYVLEEKSPSLRELGTYMDYCKERMLAAFEEDLKEQ